MKIPTDRQIYETELSTICMDDEGILCSISKKNVPLSIQRLKAVYLTVNEITKGKKICSLTEMSNVSSGGKEIHEYAKREMEKFTKALALISKTNLSVMIGNIFLALHSPSFPIKLFTNAGEAKAWLKQYL